MRTLIADDNSEIRRALALLLEELGERDIVEAADMAEAIEACGSRGPGASTGLTPGLLLLDWELPSGTFHPADPAAFLSVLREVAPGCRVIAMSARPEAAKESLTAGCNAFASRTDPPDRLVTLISSLTEPGEGRAAG